MNGYPQLVCEMKFAGCGAMMLSVRPTLQVTVEPPRFSESLHWLTVTTKNASKIRARIIAEGANGPTTAAADALLDDKGIFVVPDILANAGGVTVSYFEWVQDLQQLFWHKTEVIERLKGLLDNAFMRVMDKRSWVKVILVSVGVSAALFWLFEIQFMVPLPKGPLEALLGY